MIPWWIVAPLAIAAILVGILVGNELIVYRGRHGIEIDLSGVDRIELDWDEPAARRRLGQ